jgi:hypothetical protein
MGPELQEMSGGNVDQMLQRLRDPQTAQQLATVTGASASEVQRTLDDIATRVEASRDDPAQATAAVREGMQPLIERAKQNAAQLAERAQPAASRAAWISFGALLISLFAAVAGAAVGRRSVARRATGQTT